MACWLSHKYTAPPNQCSLTRGDLLSLSIAWIVLAAVIAGSAAHFACAALNQWGTAGTEAAKAFETMNRNCDNGKESCGTLADLNQTLRTVRGTFGQIEMAAKHEDTQLGTLDKQEKTIFNDLHGISRDARKGLGAFTSLTNAASGAVGTAQETMIQSQPALASLNASLTQYGALAQSVKKRIDDPRVDVLLTHLDGTATHIDGATGDVETVFDRVANPKPCTGKWCWAIKTARVINAAKDMPEFGYWTNEFIQSLRGH